ncbi:MAG: peptidylprolyl isomerase [Desulfopila sp.]
MYRSPRLPSAVIALFAFAVLVALTTLLVPTHHLRAEMVDRVVAVVNDEVITLSELEKEGEKVFRQLAATTPSAELPAALARARAEILETMIDKHLINQKAKERKITVSDAEVEAAFQNVMKMTGLTREQLLGKLEESGVDEQIYRSTLRTQLLQNKLVGADLSSKVIITDDMLLDYYDNHYATRSPQQQASSATGSYYLLQIGCSWQGGDRNEARKRAETAHDLAVAGDDFRALAENYSDLPSRVDGGDIGLFELNDMAADMRHVIAGLKAGEISDIVETSAGFQFFKVLSVESAASQGEESRIVAKAPFEDVKDSIREELFQQEMNKVYSQWVNELKTQAYIERL